jgi:hypothetical protein
MLATVVLISTVSTLIFATVAYIASRRPQRAKKVKNSEQQTEAPPTAAASTAVPLQTVSMDGSAGTVPMILVPDIDRAGQLAEGWAMRRRSAHAAQIEPLFKAFKVEEDVYSSLN